MKSYSIFAALLLGLVVFASAPVARAQTAAPIPVIRTVNPAKPSSPKISQNWLKAEVVHADSNSIVVRELANERVLHSFTYSSQLKPRMEKIESSGGYHYGDKVKILCQPGGTVALKIHGKPSSGA